MTLLVSNSIRIFVNRAWTEIRKLHIEKIAHIINGDLLKQNYSSADLVTVYLLPGFIDKVQPLLDQQLKKGSPRGGSRFRIQELDAGEGREYRRRWRRAQPYAVPLPEVNT